MKKYSFKERIRYWFDNRMAGGTSSMIKMLAICTIVIVLLVASIISVFGLQEEGGFFYAFWNALATIINAWMPYADEGGAGYIILTALVAIIGVLFTSVLIGIVGTIIEEKLTDLRKGNSRILEEDHVVLLGFKEGEYELLRQLVIAAEQEKRCIVIADEMEREEMETAIHDNIDIPKNVRIICRNVNICDSVALDCCSIPDCNCVIISPLDDAKTIKVILAVTSLLKDHADRQVKLITAVHSDEYLLPSGIQERRNVIMLQTNDVIAKIIARSCTQPGLSDTFLEILNFDGSEIYIVPSEAAVGLRFGEIVCNTNHSVPIGIVRDGKSILNPPVDTMITAEDRLISFAESRTAAHIHMSHNIWNNETVTPIEIEDAPLEHVIVLGFNEVFDTIIRELPRKPITVTIAGADEEEIEQAIRYAADRDEIDVTAFEGNLADPAEFEKLILSGKHVVLLSDHTADDEEADIKNMLLLLKIRDIRIRHQLDFTITTEMQRENNRKLVACDSQIDFVVASNMSSMVLAQTAENPELYEVFSELLSNVGNDLCLKEVRNFGYNGEEITIAELRKKALLKGYICLGYLRYQNDTYHVVLNPDYHKTITLQQDDSLILVG